MGSSGGGGGGNPNAMFMNVAPMADLPIAGKDSAVGSPYEYGKFQSFLPDIKAEGPNDMATGLRPEMFQYKSPSGVVAQSDQGNQIQSLRDQLAQLQAAQAKMGSGGSNQFGAGEEDWRHQTPWTPQVNIPSG
jgi:hypothetical protein